MSTKDRMANPEGPDPTAPRGVEFRSVDLVRRGRLLVSSLTLSVKPGESLAIMGPSGAGKTTLVRTAAGLAPPSAGAVVRPRGRVATVFQDPRLLPWRTALANVELVLDRSEQRLARHWIERVGLADALDVYPTALSGGMRQRVAIARALAYQAPLVVVDEPFAHLDTVTAQDLRQELSRQLESTGATVLWVTHDPAEAEAVAHRTLVMAGPPHGAWTVVDHVDRAPSSDRAPAKHRLALVGDPTAPGRGALNRSV